MNDERDGIFASSAADLESKWPSGRIPKDNAYEYWAKSEDIAMHFNHLILNFRLKALGFIGLAAGVAIGFFGKNGAVPWSLMAYAFGVLSLVWLLLAKLDLDYYYLLLRGAVDEILRIEDQYPHFQMSKRIEKRVQSMKRSVAPQSERPEALVFCVYALGPAKK